MLNHLKRMRNQGGEVVGLPFVDATAAAFQALLGATTDVVFTLPAAAGATDVPPGLIVNAAGPPVVPGDCIVGAIRIDAAALDAGISIQQCWVSTAGGPGVGQITARILNTTAGNIPGAPAARTFRFFLLR
jgi:hypothetical protein